jgi:hypothetical protein
VEFPIPLSEQPQFGSIQEHIDFLVTTQFRPEQSQVGYNTIISNDMFIINTNDLLEDRLDKYKVRFIE